MPDNPFANPMTEQPEEAGAEENTARKPTAQTRSGGTSYKAQMLRSNVIMGLLFAAAGGGLYFLSLQSSPAEASAEQRMLESTVDSALMRLREAPEDGGGYSGRITQDLLEGFSDRIIACQVPLKSLEKNPFAFVAPEGQTKAVVKTAPKRTKKPEKTPEQISREQAMARLEKLHLQSVMMGRDGGGVAVISNNLLSVGQRIDGFTVERIDSNSVVLSWRSEKFTLRMELSGS